jgi:hypothetical protein
MSGRPGGSPRAAHEFMDGDRGEGASMQMSAYRDHSPTQRN